jgi:hypothetical protein
MNSGTSRKQPTEIGPYTRPDAPPPEEDVEPRAGQAPPAGDDRDDLAVPPMTGSEATSSVAHGTARETGAAGEGRGDAVDGSEGSATGGRSAR